MAGYNTIKGLRVKYLSADPSNPEDGQVWYNSTTGNLRVQGIGVGAWSSGSNLSTYRYGMAAGGIQTAAFVGGGYQNPSARADTEEYNGSGWATGGNMNTARMYIGGSGTQTAGLASGGDQYPSPRFSILVEEYDGSSWTVQNTLPTQNKNMGSCGTQTASLNIGGSTPSATNVTNSYDGTNWTNTGHNLNTARFSLRAVGTTTSALVNGGSPNVATSEEYNGSSWTSVTSSPNTFDAHASAGTQTAAAMFAGGNPSGGVSTDHNQYDGTTWTSAPSLALGRYYAGMGPIGTSSSALCAGGNGPSSSAAGVATEEYNFSTTVTTAAAWASGATLPSPGRQGYGVGTGTQTASIIAGGPPDSTQNQFYDGSAWTGLASIPAGVTNSQGFGDSEELLMAGGNTGAPYSALTYVYSRPGNSWTAVASPGNINTARGLGAGCGALSTAGIIAGGDTPSYTTATESWNGSAWTTVNALPTATGNGVGSCGTQTAGLIWSGENPGDPTAEETYEWDGTNWTSSGNRIIGVRAVRGGAGTQTAALTFGGWLDPGGSVSTEGYDGTSWSTRPNMAGAAANNFQTGTQTAALRAGGTDGPGYTAVEEFTGETTALNIKTITTS